jgi:hypothetical protein
MSIETKVDKILEDVGDLKTSNAEIKKDLATNSRDIQELRSDLWGSGDIKKKSSTMKTQLSLLFGLVQH